MPMWQRLYVLSGALPWQQPRRKEIFLSSISAPSFSSFCLVPCQISSSFSLPPPSFPLSSTCSDMVCRFLGGECSGMRSHTHNLSVCFWCSRLGNNESQKRLSFKRNWNFNTVSKLWFAERASSVLSGETPLVHSAAFLINLPLCRSSSLPL